ncbi:MAG: sterol desaturase family protein, partial [Nannocystaceae bacterium]
QVHHSAETLTAFTLYRVHPVESALYQARGIVVTGAVTALFYYFFRGAAVENQIFGVNILGVACSAIGGNLRHSHTFWSWGPRLERWLISPAQHQLHHARSDVRGQVNYGTWLAIWDRLGGSLSLAGPDAPTQFGLHAHDLNHNPHRLGSVLLDPIVALLPRRQPAWLPRPSRSIGLTLSVCSGGLWMPNTARAQSPESEPPPTVEQTESGTLEAAVPENQAPPESESPPEADTTVTEPSPPAPGDPSSDDEATPAPDIGTEQAPAEPTTDAVSSEERDATAEDEDDADVDLSDFYDDASTDDASVRPEDRSASDSSDAEEPDVDTRGVQADIAAPTVSIIGEPEELPRIVGSAHLVDEATLERDENDDIERVLRTVPGVYVRGEDGFGLRPNIGLRGVDPNRSSKITLMEDGILLGPAPYAAPAAYYFPMPTRMVGIEVFKGPAAVRHGPNTIGGAINLRTRDIPRENDGGLDLAMGQRGYGKAHGYWGRSWKHFGMLVEGVRLQSNGFKEL